MTLLWEEQRRGQGSNAPTFASFLKIDFIFYSSYRFTAKLSGRYRDFPYAPHPIPTRPPPLSTSPPQSGTFVTVNEPTPIHHNHPKSVVYIRAHSWCCTFYWFGKFIMICTHHYYIIRRVFTALKILYAPPVHPSLPTPTHGNHRYFYFLYSFFFSRMSYSWNHRRRSLFRLASFT